MKLNDIVSGISAVSFKVLLPLSILILFVVTLRLLKAIKKLLIKVDTISLESVDTVTKVDKMMITVDNTAAVMNNVFQSKNNYTNEKIALVGKMFNIPILANVENNFLGSIITTFKK